MVAASQIPQVRDDLASVFESGLIGMTMANHVLHEGGHMCIPRPEIDAATWGQAMAGYERRLCGLVDVATLFHVAPEMVAVADTARQTMPGYNLHREDLPAERGLIVFDSPIGRFDREGDPEVMPEYDRRRVLEARAAQREVGPASVIGALWGPAISPDGEPGVLVVTFADTSELADYRERQGDSPAAVMALRRTGALTYHDETVLPWGEHFDESRGPDAPVRNAALGTLIATWLLMGQPIVSTNPEPLPRQTRRGRERAGLRVPEVRVVRLRHAQRPRAEAEETASGRTYTKRWIVRGHWRNQWYASRQAHRPKYIPMHVKGPDGAELIITTETVYDWRK